MRNKAPKWQNKSIRFSLLDRSVINPLITTEAESIVELGVQVNNNNHDVQTRWATLTFFGVAKN